MAACAVGESAALAALFDRYQRVVLRYLSRLCGLDSRELDDLVQATFIEVQRSCSAFSARSSVKTWLLGIATNVARHHARSQTRQRALHTAAAAAFRPQPASRPDQIAEQRELLARLQTALDGLSHDLRVAFVMCELEEVPGVEAARVLGIREGTLWRRLHDARRKLRAAIEGEAP